MEHINREDHQKLYMQLYEIMKKKIEAGEWAVGSQIPTEDEICKMFNVSRATVRTAILELVRQGYLKRQQGKGTFIFRNVISEGLSMLTNFSESLFDEGIHSSISVLARTVMMPVDDLADKLDITQDKHIIYIKRLRLIGNEPILLQESYVPYNICPLLLEDDLERSSLLDLFEKKYGIRITRIINHLDVAYLNTDESRLFGLEEDSAALLMTQLFYSGDTVFMYMRSVKRPDRFQISIELERKAI